MVQQTPAILLFDGDCGFCTSASNFVVRRSTFPVTAVAWQLTDPTRYGLSQQQTADRVWLVIGDQRFGGHLAFATLLRIQRNLALRALGIVLSVPPFLWFGHIGYALVARFRHRLPGGTPACRMPPAG